MHGAKERERELRPNKVERRKGVVKMNRWMEKQEGDVERRETELSDGRRRRRRRDRQTDIIH